MLSGLFEFLSNIDLKALVVFFMAIIPALVWIYLLFKNHYQNRWLVLMAFVGGMIAARLILIYQGYWDQTINLVFFKVDPVSFKSNIKNIFSTQPLLALFLSFVGVGVIEEFLKFWVMKFFSRRFFTSIDGVIQLAVVSALGFAFFENIIYFSRNWGSLSVGNFFIFASIRVTIVSMVHMLCSGILGYYYGMAHFASPMLKLHHIKKKDHPILAFIKRVFYVKKSEMFHTEMVLIGMFLSMGIHALYDFFLSVNINLLGVPLVMPVMFIYFFGGYWYLNTLLEKKDLQLKLGLVGTSIMPTEDFKKLLGEIQLIKERMANGQPVPAEIAETSSVNKPLIPEVGNAAPSEQNPVVTPPNIG